MWPVSLPHWFVIFSSVQKWAYDTINYKSIMGRVCSIQQMQCRSPYCQAIKNLEYVFVNAIQASVFRQVMTQNTLKYCQREATDS